VVVDLRLYRTGGVEETHARSHAVEYCTSAGPNRPVSRSKQPHPHAASGRTGWTPSVCGASTASMRRRSPRWRGVPEPARRAYRATTTRSIEPAAPYCASIAEARPSPPNPVHPRARRTMEESGTGRCGTKAGERSPATWGRERMQASSINTAQRRPGDTPGDTSDQFILVQE